MVEIDRSAVEFNKNIFDCLDYDKDGVISKNDILELFNRIELDVTSEDAELLLDNICLILGKCSEKSEISGLCGLEQMDLQRFYKYCQSVCSSC